MAVRISGETLPGNVTIKVHETGTGTDVLTLEYRGPRSPFTLFDAPIQGESNETALQRMVDASRARIESSRLL